MSATLTRRPPAAILPTPVLDKSYRETPIGHEVAAYLDWLENERGLAEATVENYESILGGRLCTALPRKRPQDVTKADVRGVIALFPKGSRNGATHTLNAFWRWLFEEERIDHAPMRGIRVPKLPPQKVVETFTAAEQEALVAQPELRDGVLVLLLLGSGIRNSEARALRRLNVNLEDGFLTVLKGKGRKDRIVPLPQRVVSRLAEFITLDGIEPTDQLWYYRASNGRYAEIRRDRPVSEGRFAKWWTACMTTAAVPYRKPHTTRHTMATEWLRVGGNITVLSKTLGHASIKTTVDEYGHLMTPDFRAEVDRVEALRFPSQATESESGAYAG